MLMLLIIMYEEFVAIILGTMIFRLPVKRNRTSVYFFTVHVKIHQIPTYIYVTCEAEFMFFDVHFL